jgi:hypothetical protein
MSSRKIKGASGLKITAAICAPRFHEALPKALSSLVRQSLPKDDYEILVVCDEKDGTTNQFVNDAVSGARLVACATYAPSQIRVVATDAAQAPLVAFLSPNAVADSRWLESICGGFDAYGDTGRILGGRVKPLWSAARPSWLHDDLLSFLSLTDLGDELRFVDIGERLSAANFAVRKKYVQFAKLFDLQLDRALADGPPGIEDGSPLLDSSRDAEAGVFYCPSAVVQRHIPVQSLTQDWFRRRAAWQAALDRQLGPAPPASAVTERWKSAKVFLYESAPHERTIRGLIVSQDNARRFRQQVFAIYDSVYCFLSGVRETANE